MAERLLLAHLFLSGEALSAYMSTDEEAALEIEGEEEAHTDTHPRSHTPTHTPHTDTNRYTYTETKVQDLLREPRPCPSKHAAS